MALNSAILLQDRKKEDFIGLIFKMARNTKSSGHKIYFMIFCFVGVGVFRKEKLTNIQSVSRIVNIGIFMVRSMMIIIMKRNQFTNMGCVEIFITKVFAAQLIQGRSNTGLNICGLNHLYSCFRRKAICAMKV